LATSEKLVTELPRIEAGWVLPMAGAGLGTELNADIKRRDNAAVRETRA
jgi:hypothetical protein